MWIETQERLWYNLSQAQVIAAQESSEEPGAFAVAVDYDVSSIYGSTVVLTRGNESECRTALEVLLNHLLHSTVYLSWAHWVEGTAALMEEHHGSPCG